MGNLSSESLAERFQRFARLECHDSSPLYERLSLGIAADQRMLAMAAHAQKGQPAPNLFFAAVHWLLLKGVEHPISNFYPSVSETSACDEDPYPYFRSFCLEWSEEILKLITTRLVQTNVVRRSACLLPAFGLVSQLSRKISPTLSLVEIGAAAGLNLLWDRYGYNYGQGLCCGDPDSPVQIACAVRGDQCPPVPPVYPRVAYRVGLELNPIDVNDSESTLWLRALVWPEHQEQANLLQNAIRLAQQDPPQLITGNALELLPDILSTVPQDSSLCVFHTHTINQFSPEARELLSALIAGHGAKRDLFLVSMEWAGLDPEESHGLGHSLLKLVSFHRGVETVKRLACCDPHGRWIQWLEGGTAC
jgi:hypothetical protein